ncbi:hypothetical protein DFH29DRAFT_876702 [Suillus ampliporus]|nr:hypothetical protein DFH29DRAFT_876702 [Suillus ampliporus]
MSAHDPENQQFRSSYDLFKPMLGKPRYLSARFSFALLTRRCSGVTVQLLPCYTFPHFVALSNSSAGYRSKSFNYINSSESNVSGILSFLTDKLQDADDAGDRGRQWSEPHKSLVCTSLPNVSSGVTHTIFYTNNGTNMSVETAQMVSWLGDRKSSSYLLVLQLSRSLATQHNSAPETSRCRICLCPSAPFHALSQPPAISIPLRNLTTGRYYTPPRFRKEYTQKPLSTSINLRGQLGTNAFCGGYQGSRPSVGKVDVSRVNGDVSRARR